MLASPMTPSLTATCGVPELVHAHRKADDCRGDASFGSPHASHCGGTARAIVQSAAPIPRPFPEGKRMIGVYAGVWFSAILAFLFARLDRRR